MSWKENLNGYYIFVMMFYKIKIKMYENFVWQKFWKQTIIEISKVWTCMQKTDCICRCDCGTVAYYRLSSLYYGWTTMCPKCRDDLISKKALEKAKSHIWEKHWRLTILDVINYRAWEWWRKKWYNKFLCKCDCWKEKEIMWYRVLNWEIISCGCANNILSQHRLDIKNLLWTKYWHLTLVWEDEYDWKKWVHQYYFSCDCGSGKIVKWSLYDVKHWKILSCWCEKSQKQIDLCKYVEGLWFNVISDYSFEPRWIQIDIFVPEKNIWFEFNWCFYHDLSKKERLYHYNKKKYFSEKWINIVFIREDERDSKTELIKNFIKNKLWISKKVWARMLEIKNITSLVYEKFCETYHLQWSSKRLWICYWWFYNWGLVCVAWFDSKWVMDRYCIKIWYSINWWLMRFCNKYFNEYKKDITTYANLDIVDIKNNIYNKSWFVPWNIDFWWFYVEKRRSKKKLKYRLYDRSLKSKLWIKKIDNNVLNKYYHCIWAWIQKYVLPYLKNSVK